MSIENRKLDMKRELIAAWKVVEAARFEQKYLQNHNPQNCPGRICKALREYDELFGGGENAD